MSDSNVKVDVDNSAVALVLLLIFFYGEPDLVDALIHWLMK